MFTKNKKLLSLLLCGSLLLGAGAVDKKVASAEESTQNTASTTETAATGSAVTGDENTIDTSKASLSKTSINLMKGKKKTLTVNGLDSTANVTVTWSSQDTAVATVTEAGVIKAVKVGKTTIEADVAGTKFSCAVNVVAKMAKKDFGKFNKENFINYCQRKGYDGGYAWQGQWKGGSKKKKTYRGVKIGTKKGTINKKYGDLAWAACTSKDPFTKMKGLKKNKVKTYADVKYGKYRIRFYLNSKKKVVAIILACNIGKIKKKALKSYM